MTYSEEQIRAMVRKVLLRTLGPNGLEHSLIQNVDTPWLARQTKLLIEA